MSDFSPEHAAGILHQLRTARRTVLPLPAQHAPRTVHEGAAVQRLLAVHLGACPPAGFKIGATAQRMQEYLGLSGPAAGFMAPAGLLNSGASLPFSELVQPGAECEIAVRLGRDLPPRQCTQDQAGEAVGELFAAIEVVENRYDDLALLGTPTLIADQVFHRAAVLGRPAPGDWRALDYDALNGQISVNGEVRSEGRATDLLGHPLNSLAWLAGSPVAAAFGGLKAGQVVMLGSVTPPIWLTHPCTVTVEFAPLPPVVVQLL
jgi:2-keto-4-pentenoate hydratase